MADRWPRVFVGVVAFLFFAPLSVLPIQAIANEWRSPALWPQVTGWRGFSAVANDAVVPSAIGNSALIGFLAVVMALALGWPAARALAQPPIARRSAVLLLLPLLLPPLVVGEGLQVWFLRLGLADRLFGVAVAHLVYVVPYVVLLLMSGFTTELLEQEQAASSLGASTLARFRLVTLPAIRNSLLLAAAMGFTVSWSQYGTTLGVGGGIPTLPLVLVPFVRSDPQVAAVLDLILLGPPLLVLLFAETSSLRNRTESAEVETGMQATT